MNLGDLLNNAAEKYPNQCAVIDGTRTFNFAQVKAETDNQADRIKRRIHQAGDRVALLISNCPAFSISYFATLQAGAIVVPLNVLYSDEEIVRILLDCQASVLVVESQWVTRCQFFKRQIPDCKIIQIPSNPLVGMAVHESKPPERLSQEPNVAGETAAILYTSGTTGQPKGVELTHANLLSNAKCVSEEKFSTVHVSNILGPGDVGLAALPLSHAFGQTNVQNGLWFSGGAIAYCSRFDANRVIAQIVSSRVTFFAGVPTMYFDLVRAGRDLTKMQDAPRLATTLQFCVCGGAALSKDIKKEFAEIFGTSIQESYGLTETSPMISCQAIDQTQKSGCVGKPISNAEIRIVNDQNEPVQRGAPGELQVRGENVFKGYFGQPEKTQEVFSGEWFVTGDIAMLDEDDELWIVDRSREIINRGGYNIFPREIENVILSLDFIAEAAVFGCPDQRMGEEIKAVVSLNRVHLNQPQEKPESEIHKEIQWICQKELAAYKYPRIIEIMDCLPRGSTGKIDRKKLRKL